MWALQITHFNISDERKFLPNPLRRHNDIVWLKLIQIIIESNCLSVNSSFEGCQPHKLTLTIPKLNRKIIPSQEPPESREKERKKKVNVLVLKKKRDIINFLRYKCIWLEYLLFVISFHVCLFLCFMLFNNRCILIRFNKVLQLSYHVQLQKIISRVYRRCIFKHTEKKNFFWIFFYDLMLDYLEEMCLKRLHFVNF